MLIVGALIWANVMLYRLTTIGELEKATREERVPMLVASQAAGRNFAEASLEFRDYMIYGEDPQRADQYNGLRKQAWEQFFLTIDKMRPLAKGEEQQLVDQIAQNGRAGMNLQEEVLHEGGHGLEARKQAAERMKAGAPLLAQIGHDINALNADADAALDKNNAQIGELLTSVRHHSILLMLISFLLVVPGLLISTKVAALMKSLTDRLGEIRDGDLRGEALPEDCWVEYAEIFRSVNAMHESLKEIILSVTERAEKVALASEEISSSASQIAQSMERQKDQATQVATAMQEMSVTVTQVGDSSTKASESARTAGELALTGGNVVGDTVRMIQGVAESTRETAQKIETLGHSGKQIGVIIGVIDDIADQTNLLALNAAIEAARAGEQGRGFAVVADEVRKLAERTTKATKEVAAMIQTIQEETAKAVQAMEAGTEKVDAGVMSANQASEALSKIIESSEGMQEMVTHIAAASVQQTAAANDVNQSMDEIARAMQQSTASASESARSCQQLNELGLDLQQLVSRFRTGVEESSYHSAYRSAGAAIQHRVQ
jgi:methyl-accepting chemotaxis protein